MSFFTSLSDFLGTAVTPISLFICSAVVFCRTDFLRILAPRSFFRTIRDLPDGSRSSPFRALSVALAGTLGVGNITGVASALLAGGPGAVFWMWVGCVAVLPVKYAEVSLAVQFRRRNQRGFFGGAMYYIRDGLAGIASPKFSAFLGGLFAVLCALNSLVTGNIVQSNAAACVFPESARLWCGLALALLVLIPMLIGTEKVERITSAVIPPLCLLYMGIALYIILSNAVLIPSILGEIFASAFAPSSVFGGAVGFSVAQAMRYGVIRGIFSNEAGCGTSPTAHASAETKSPHHQACYGIVEVVFDTLVLCTLTALVLLIADKRFALLPWGECADVSPLTLSSFTRLTGEPVYYLLVGSIFLFAYATIIAQLYYGVVAVGYFSGRKTPRLIYSVLSLSSCVAGSVMTAPVMWTLADTIIGIMTAVNCIVIILLRRRLSRLDAL